MRRVLVGMIRVQVGMIRVQVGDDKGLGWG